MSRNTFKPRIQRSLADEHLQTALDNNALRRKASRLGAFATLPDHQERRTRAHAIKAEVVARLEEYLEQFTARAEENGIRIHRAVDAGEAVQVILGVCRTLQKPDGAPLLVAKSKSMISEEIDLNHALEAQGMRAVETDLGEYIVQLRNERPSHIITPAVHLTRSDVGRLFEEKLGLPYTEDIPVLTNTARKVLRRVFLEADVGLSGVNFGVAESGTLCLVTNEGNGRMVTTLPRVHIALMGIERLVPTLDDLALFLSLLPRSATGQKLSVYTSLVHAPLPGQTRHLVLLDNGRRALRNSPLAESLYCIRCGACLNACPVFRELGGHAYGSIYPGPIGSVISSGLVDPSFAYLAQASSLCGACREACPVDIDLPGLLLRVRAGEAPGSMNKGQNQGEGIPAVVKLGLRGFRLAAASAPVFSFFQGVGGFFSRLYSPRRATMRIPAWTGWGYSKEFPRLAARSFRKRWKGIRQEVDGEKAGGTREVEAPANPASPTPALVEQFRAELTVLGGKVYLVKETDAPGEIGRLLRDRQVEQVAVDEAGAAYVTGIPAVRSPNPGIHCGLTGAACGIAETGSLLLGSASSQALTASLLPEMHIAVLRASQVVPTVAEAMKHVRRQEEACVIITGPSRTADIEMTLTIGVHGPGELHVFLIDDSNAT